MGNKNAELVDEIRQVLVQYRREVPGQRRAWPESIKRRVFELHDRGVKFNDIARQTKLSYHTLVSWSAQRRNPAASFAVVKVVPALPAPAAPAVGTVTVPVATRRAYKRKDATVTVTTRTGIRIRFAHVSIGHVVQLVGRLEGRA